MNGFDLSTIQGLYYGVTECSAIYKGSTLIWESNSTYDKQYLTFESLEDGNEIGFKKYSNSTSPRDIEYSTDKVNWTVVSSSYSGSSGTILATLNTGDKLYLKGTNSSYDDYVNSTHEYNCFTSSKTFNLYGNIMSLVNASTFKTLTSFNSNYIFYSLFIGTKVVDASNLVLPLNTTNSCYMSMFSGCTSLTSAPVLPATTLSDNCYREMFSGCTSLTSAPALPATTLTSYCYRQMFFGCSSLTTAPALPATTLAVGCYYAMFRGCGKILEAPVLLAKTLTTNCYNKMFYGCSKLNYIKMLATDISATSCLGDWVNGVASTGSFIKDANMTSLPTGTSGIPSSWTTYNNDADYYNDQYFTIESLEDDNTLTFTTSNNSNTPTIQYSSDKTNWNSVTATTEEATITTINKGDKIYFKGNNNAYSSGSSQESYISSSKNVNIYGNILSLHNPTSFSTITSISNASNYLFRALLKGIKVIDASNLILRYADKYGCYMYLFYNCSTLLTPPKLPATTLSNACYMCMFYNCTSLTSAPELPATTLTTQCYQAMFYNCTSLTSAPELPATTLANYCYRNMFYGCKSLNYVKMLATTNINATDCLLNWLYNVSSTGTFIKDASMTSLPTGTSGIPSGWTVQDAS